MGKNVFEADTGLDKAFLDAVYENDTQTAAAIFEQYLIDLPSDLASIHHCFCSGDREQFRSLIHKKKVGFSYVGLTAVTADFSELEKKCNTGTDLKEFQKELESVLKRINESTEAVREVLKRL